MTLTQRLPDPSQETESVRLPHGPTRVRWRRSARARHVTLRIDPRAAAVVVTLPPRTGRKQGMALLVAHSGWVAERLGALHPAIPFACGTLLPVAGQWIRIRHEPGLRGTRLAPPDHGQIPSDLVVGGSADHLARRVGDWLKAEARRHFAQAALAKAQLLGRRIRRVAVKDTRSRWGSCAPDGTLSFSWRLLLAPPEVIDYVIAHEVAHLAEMNHGPRFWATVETLTPHGGFAKAWLHGEGGSLLRFGADPVGSFRLTGD